MARSAQPVEKKAGRPAKSPELGKRVNVMFRLNEKPRDTVMFYAEQNGRSMSEEIERRIEASISEDLRLDTLAKFVGGFDRVMFSSMVNAEIDKAIKEVEKKRGGQKWIGNQDAIDEVVSKLKDSISACVMSYAWMVSNGLADRFADIYARKP